MVKQNISIILFITFIISILVGCGSPTRSNDTLYAKKLDSNKSEIDQIDDNVTNSDDNSLIINYPSKPKLTQPFVKVLKTGQTYIYSNYDDGYYQFGVDRNYTRDDKNEVVIDHVNNLMWQDDIYMRDLDLKKSYKDAILYCENLTLANYDDWRVPHIKELQTIVDDSKYEPALISTFQNYVKSYYYSSTKFVGDDELVWVLFFVHGNSATANGSNKFYVRCVRDYVLEN